MAEDRTPSDGDHEDDDDTPTPMDMFGGLPMFGDLLKQMQGQGPLSWDTARQFALLGASGGAAEPNVEPADRIALTDLSRIVGPQLNDVGQFDIQFPEPNTMTRTQWALDTLDAYRPLFTELATSLGKGTSTDAVADDPMLQMMANLNQMAAPGMLGMAVGSMVGTFAQRAFGLHDLPIPRARQSVVLVPVNIDEFESQWQLPRDEVRLWAIANELAGYAVFSIATLRDGLAEMVRHHVGAFEPDPNALGDKLAGLEVSGDPMQSIQRAFSDPAILLGAIASPAQRDLQPALDAAVAMVVGYVDWLVDGVTVRLVGGDALAIAEAARRRRAEAAQQDAFVERLLGIRIDAAQLRNGKEFIQGVVDRAGEAELARLLARQNSLPTPNELAAPGLWLERVRTSPADGQS